MMAALKRAMDGWRQCNCGDLCRKGDHQGGAYRLRSDGYGTGRHDNSGASEPRFSPRRSDRTTRRPWAPTTPDVPLRRGSSRIRQCCPVSSNRHRNRGDHRNRRGCRIGAPMSIRFTSFRQAYRRQSQRQTEIMTPARAEGPVRRTQPHRTFPQRIEIWSNMSSRVRQGHGL